MKFDVEKSIVINALLATVRGLVEDFNQWNSWSSWTVIEPDCEISITGNANESGHSMS
jgi:hypothetical protein